MSSAQPTRLVLIVTDPLSASVLMGGELRFLAQQAFDVHVIASPGELLEKVQRVESIPTTGIPMSREIAPLKDIKSLLCLYSTLRRLAPDIVIASTPKAALLGLLAARFAGVPVRFLTLRGLRLETARGMKRWVLRLSERVSSESAHHVFCVSQSLRARGIAEGFVRSENSSVPGLGSSHGVDTSRFRPRTERERLTIRTRLGIPQDANVLGFVGRLTRDKGIEDLWETFLCRVFPEHRNAWLLLVGDIEAGDRLPKELIRQLRQHPHVLMTGFAEDPAELYATIDVLVLPSYREGFPNVPLEAAACRVPSVGYAATGTVDAIVDGETGMLVPRGDRAALGAAIRSYLERPDLRLRHGEAARDRACRDFDSNRVWRAWADAYRDQARRVWVRHQPHPRRREESERREWYGIWGKRALDLLLGLPLAVALLPLALLVAALIRWRDGAPMLFRQARPGLGCEPFTLLKFRTMKAEGADRSSDEARLTKLGQFLRRLSLDELPQLWNVLRGEMSLVGPRPLLIEYLDRYSQEQARRHEVKPGITGWAQVNGRNALSWREKFEHDVWYVDHLGLWLDLRILARTVWRIVRGTGVSAEGHATMPPFLGSTDVEP